MDETLTGDDEGLRALVAELGGRGGVPLVVNSSRPLGSVVRTLGALCVRLEPVCLITSMGTEVTEGGRAVAEWSRRFAGWDRGRVDAVMHRLGYRAHEAELQSAWKASFAVPPGEVERVERSLTEAGVKAQLIASGASDLDILPPGAGKGEATGWVAQRMGVGREGLMVAGDSGNDLAMFCVSDRGIVVGNARAELRERVDAGRVYFAEGARAWGVMEGLRHWGAVGAVRERGKEV